MAPALALEYIVWVSRLLRTPEGRELLKGMDVPEVEWM